MDTLRHVGHTFLVAHHASEILHKKIIIKDEVLLKFHLYSLSPLNKLQKEKDRGGISLGNLWSKA